MKKYYALEWIGAALMMIGLVFMILENTWENNPIPFIIEEWLLFNSIGLLAWSFGYIKREGDMKRKSNLLEEDHKQN